MTNAGSNGVPVESCAGAAMNGNALAVMVKAPVPGSVKTRMVPPLTHQQAALLYECLARDTFSSLSVLKGVDIYAACLGPPDAVRGMVPDGIEIFAQCGDGLGARMCSALGRLLSKGYKRAAVVGSDLPDLPARYVEEAFALLEGGASLSLGPATDGGYYLVAVDGPYESLFTGIRYSTPTVLDETLAKARKHSIEYALASPWHDIDDAKDLKRLQSSRRAPLSSAFIKSLGILR